MQPKTINLLKLLLSLFLFFITTAQANTAEIRIMPEDDVEVPAGEVISVAIEVVDIQNLWAFDVILTFNPAVVNVLDTNPDLGGVQIGFGTFMNPGFILINQADNETGVVRYAMTQLNPSVPKSGSGNIAVIQFTGLEIGQTSALEILQASLVTINGETIPIDVHDGEISVIEFEPGTPSATPIPTQGGGTPLPTMTWTAIRTPTSTGLPTQGTLVHSPTLTRTTVPSTPTRTNTVTVPPTNTVNPIPTRSEPTMTRSPEPSDTAALTLSETEDPVRFSLTPTQVEEDFEGKSTGEIAAQSEEILSETEEEGEANKSEVETPDSSSTELKVLLGIGVIAVVMVIAIIIYSVRDVK